MHMRQCRKVSRLTSRVLAETFTFVALLRLLRAAQVVPRWNMVASVPGFSLLLGARFRFLGTLSMATLTRVLWTTQNAKIVRTLL